MRAGEKRPINSPQFLLEQHKLPIERADVTFSGTSSPSFNQSKNKIKIKNFTKARREKKREVTCSPMEKEGLEKNTAIIHPM